MAWRELDPFVILRAISFFFPPKNFFQFGGGKKTCFLFFFFFFCFGFWGLRNVLFSLPKRRKARGFKHLPRHSTGVFSFGGTAENIPDIQCLCWLGILPCHLTPCGGAIFLGRPLSCLISLWRIGTPRGLHAAAFSPYLVRCGSVDGSSNQGGIHCQRAIFRSDRAGGLNTHHTALFREQAQCTSLLQVLAIGMFYA